MIFGEGDHTLLIMSDFYSFFFFIMVDNTTALTNVSIAMLTNAVEEDSQHGVTSIMDQIATVKVYNPAPNEDADPAKDGKFIITPANWGEPEIVEGPLNVTFFHVSYVLQGKIYFRDNGKVRDTHNFVTSSEFGRYTKRIELLSLATKGKCILTLPKEDLEKFIRNPSVSLNGERTTNPFYMEASDVNKKPYDSSRLAKRAILYGVFNEGPYAGEKFRMFLAPQHVAPSFNKDTNTVNPTEEGTLEYAREQALDPMNAILKQNNYKEVREVGLNQIDMFINIKQNEKKNNIPKFEYVGLVAMRWIDNASDVEFIRNLRSEYHDSIFETTVPTSISIENGIANINFEIPSENEVKAIPQKASGPVDEFDVEDMFPDTPTRAF